MAQNSGFLVSVYRIKNGNITTTADQAQNISISEAMSAVSYTDANNPYIKSKIIKGSQNVSIPTEWFLGQTVAQLLTAANA